MIQNFGLAALYNIITIPLAFMGFATPLMAALAMSLSSITVTLNAFRLPTIKTAEINNEGGGVAAKIEGQSP